MLENINENGETNTKKYLYDIKQEEKWLVLNPYCWNEEDVLNWLKKILSLEDYNNRKVLNKNILKGSDIINEGYEFFINFSQELCFTLFEDFHLLVSSFDIDEKLDEISKISLKRKKNICNFIFEKLESNSSMIKWIDRNNLTFKIIEPKVLASIWGLRRNNERMNYKKMTRSLRYHYYRNLLPQYYKFVYKFSENSVIVKQIMKR